MSAHADDRVCVWCDEGRMIVDRHSTRDGTFGIAVVCTACQFQSVTTEAWALRERDAIVGEQYKKVSGQ